MWKKAVAPMPNHLVFGFFAASAFFGAFPFFAGRVLAFTFGFDAAFFAGFAAAVAFDCVEAFSLSAACAAARRAMGIRKGEQET